MFLFPVGPKESPIGVVVAARRAPDDADKIGRNVHHADIDHGV
jgi:hypothetical protein